MPLHFSEYSSVCAGRNASFSSVERQHEALKATREDTRPSHWPRILSVVPSKARASSDRCASIRRRRVWKARLASGTARSADKVTICIAWTQLAGAGIARAQFQRELASSATHTLLGTNFCRVFSGYTLIARALCLIRRELACSTLIAFRCPTGCCKRPGLTGCTMRIDPRGGDVNQTIE